MSGKIPLPEGQKVMLSQALAVMHPSDYANLKKVRVLRKNRKVIMVDVKAIFDDNKRDSDIELEDGDMINVPSRSIIF